jgi:type IV fimbrial biogenesis protein FimT
MRQLKHRASSAGFTLLEAMIAVAVMGILLVLGVPKMNDIMLARKADALNEMYAEGIRLARQQALSHNASSRLVLSPNASNGQQNWQVDVCFPELNIVCTDTTGNWSTTNTQAGGDPEGDAGYRSVARIADGMPDQGVLTTATEPADATTVYFNSLGWVDTNIAGNVRRIKLTPATAHAANVHASALVITLAGSVIKCDPDVAATDSRACP